MDRAKNSRNSIGYAEWRGRAVHARGVKYVQLMALKASVEKNWRECAREAMQFLIFLADDTDFTDAELAKIKFWESILK